MPTMMISLLDFLRHEQAQREQLQTPDGTAPGDAIRVPLELEGAIWSAIVERFDDARVDLIVDSQALANIGDLDQAAIHYLPETGAMQRTAGRITAQDRIARDRIRLNFELR